MKHLIRKFTTIISCIAVSILTIPMAVNAELVTTSAGTFDVTTVEGTFSDLESTLKEQVWWGDANLANEFVELTNDLFGPSFLNDLIFPFFEPGVFFAVCKGNCLFDGSGTSVVQGSVTLFDFNELNFFGIQNQRAEFAVATRIVEPEILLEELGTAVTGVGPGNSLADKIMLAQTFLAVPDVQSTCAMLADFLNQVRAQRGKMLTLEVADQLTADAQAIMDAIGCN